MKAALAEGMGILLYLDARLQSDSGNTNYTGFKADNANNAYVDFISRRGSMEAAAQVMAAEIGKVIATGQLSAGEVSQLQGVLAGLTGDAGMAAEYVGEALDVQAEIMGDGGKSTRDMLQSRAEASAEIVRKVDSLNRFATDNQVTDLRLSIEEVLKTSGGREDLAQNLILATKEIISGKTIAELVDILEIPEDPEPGSLSTYEARIWYLYQEAQIRNELDYSQPLEQVARDAVDMRNQIRTWAREAMSDRDWAEYLMKKDKNKTFEQVYLKYSKRGFTGDDLWKEIIESATKSRDSINKLFDLVY